MSDTFNYFVGEVHCGNEILSLDCQTGLKPFTQTRVLLA